MNLVAGGVGGRMPMDKGFGWVNNGDETWEGGLQ